ncbi:hypothetical protein GLOTRDRAFT_37773, partial [Gloeophyllum trabeum ATCC 11539]
MQVEKPETSITYHPLFCSEEANVVLGCKDGSMYFRLHAFTLKTASSWFRAMFTLPQCSDTATITSSPAASDVIRLDEDAPTLEALFRMICGLPIPPLDSYDTIEPLLYAADKYDMPGPISI